jgi:rhodanese-related sulfurtransferase
MSLIVEVVNRPGSRTAAVAADLAQRLEHAGRTTVRLEVGPDGFVDECRASLSAVLAQADGLVLVLARDRPSWPETVAHTVSDTLALADGTRFADPVVVLVATGTDPAAFELDTDEVDAQLRRIAPRGVTPTVFVDEEEVAGDGCAGALLGRSEARMHALCGLLTDLLPPSTPSRTGTPDMDADTATTDPLLIDPAEVPDLLAAGGLLIDVRHPDTRAANGDVEGAEIVDKAAIEDRFGGPEGLSEPAERDLVVLCGSVNGSGPVAARLVALGYTRVRHVRGGHPAWTEYLTGEAGVPAACEL